MIDHGAHRAGAFFAALALCTSCAVKQVESRATSVTEQRPLYSGRVRVKATTIPKGARQIAVVQAWGEVSLVPVVQELTMKARSVGANFVKVDAIYTRYLEELHTDVYSNVHSNREVPRLVVVGRAFWVEQEK